MKFLVTGSEGFIGSHLKRRINTKCMDLKLGDDCRMLSYYPEEYPDVIFHLAANLSPTDDSDVRMMRAVRNYWKESGAHLIYTSSASIYQPDTLYAVQKLYGEVLFKGAGILRLFNVYGPGGSGIINKILEEKPLEINGDGTQTRDFVHVDDVVDTLLKIAEMRYVGDTDFGLGKSVSINSLLTDVDYKYVDKSPGIMHSEAKNMVFMPTRKL